MAGKLSADSALVRLEPRADGRLIEVWRLYPPEDEKTAATWEGAPLVSGRRLWAAYAKFEGGRTIHVAACYDPADAETAPGAPVWTAELCDSPLPIAGGERTRQELLTLAGRNVVLCSNNGAVVAVDAFTGRPGVGLPLHPLAQGGKHPDRRPGPRGGVRRARVRRPGRRRAAFTPSTPKPGGSCGSPARRKRAAFSASPAAG